MLQIGGDPTRMSALLSGTIDATVFNPPLHQRAVEAGMKVIANIEEMNFPVQGSALVTTDRFIKKNPEVVSALGKIDYRIDPPGKDQPGVDQTGHQEIYAVQGRP